MTVDVMSLGLRPRVIESPPKPTPNVAWDKVYTLIIISTRWPYGVLLDSEMIRAWVTSNKQVHKINIRKNHHPKRRLLALWNYIPVVFFNLCHIGFFSFHHLMLMGHQNRGLIIALLLTDNYYIWINLYWISRSLHDEHSCVLNINNVMYRVL